MKRLLILILLFIALIILGAVWWKNGTKPVDSENKKPQIFVVEKGAGVREIANKLKKKGLIRDPVVFFLLTKRMGVDKEIQAGDFRLNPSMNVYDIIENLRVGMLDVWVTFPEGLRAEEISEILKEKMPTYKDFWTEELLKNEGYLFPDTYLIPKDAEINAIVTILRTNFDDKYKTLNTENANLAQNQIVTIASLVEREARHEEDRPLVSSVISNRLRIGMKLDIDATVQYVLGYQPDQKRWWKKGLTNADKTVNSSYNTYKVAGIPPTPIANPGLASLKAALNPAETSYLYYITDKNGVNRYAKTIEEHNSNIEKYGL